MNIGFIGMGIMGSRMAASFLRAGQPLSVWNRTRGRASDLLEFTAGRTSGYLPQTDDFFGLFYEHQLYGNVSLVGSYKWRNVTNLSSEIFGGAYRSSGFDLELNFNFGG